MDITFDSRDEYQRKAVALRLEKLLDSSIDISPIVIDGNWGTGKTEFSLKLCHYLSQKNEERLVIYIDAFKEDHCEDPLLSITAAIANALPESEKEELIKKAIPAIKFGVKTALKAGAGWILRQEADKLTDEFQQAIKDTSNAAIDGTIENLISEHMNSESNLKALNAKLRELSEKRKIILIIDELDRCRPNFAVELLEKVKHIFEAPNVKFILITNLTQLKASINHIYGLSVNSQSYLDKFIKYTIRLPETFNHDGYSAHHTSYSHWHGLIENNEVTRPIHGVLERQIEEILSIRMLSLREIETLHRNLEVYQLLTEKSLGNQKNYLHNLACFTAIYTYCFADKDKLSNVKSESAIREIATILEMNPYKVNAGNIHSTPHHALIFYGLISENKSCYEGLTNFKEEELKLLDQLLEQLTRGDYRGFNYTRTFQNVFHRLSLAL